MSCSSIIEKIKENKKYVITGIIVMALIVFITVTSSVVSANAATSKASTKKYYKVNLGEKTVAKVETKAEAEELISSVKNYYVEKDSEVLSAKCDPALSIKSSEYRENEKKPSFDNTEAVVNHLVTGDVAEKYYEVKDGDAMFEVAGNLGLTYEELADMNKDTDMEKLLPGDKVKYQKNEPLVNVTTEEKINRTEEVPFETETRESNDLYEGETKVETVGETGSADVTVKVINVNGSEEKTDKLDEKVTKEPVNQVILKGTKKRPVYVSGYGNASASAVCNSVGSGTGSAIASYARQWAGITPYVSRGASLTGGADCSGFVTAVYSHFGYSIPHSSYALRSAGRPVSLSNIAPGDIILYQGHASIYVGGGCEVHALTPAMGTRVTGMGTMGVGPVVSVRRVA